MDKLPRPDDLTSSYVGTYDAWNRLVKLTDGTNTVQENEYDALRRRIVRKEYSSGTLSETRRFYYGVGWQVLEERVGSETTSDAQYVWGLRY
ncbi:MAG: hypothetical protein KDA75_23385, partial [Planctomycetaceae bacterium]|nr:hypothetical protein [Planctomycetaceae bacterium]